MALWFFLNLQKQKGITNIIKASLEVSFFFFFFFLSFFFFFKGPTLKKKLEVPGLGVKSERWLPACASVTARLDLSRICKLQQLSATMGP